MSITTAITSGLLDGLVGTPEWYIGMAQNGFLARRVSRVFLLFPVLVSILAPLFGHDYVLSPYCRLHLACFGVRLPPQVDFSGVGEEGPSVLFYIAVYPMSFFLLAVYTESLFLACTVAALSCSSWAVGFAGLAAFWPP
jgi:hypothetical protein